MAPIWRAAGFALGASTALVGERAVHACTEAVESVIEKHYAVHIHNTLDAAAINVRKPKKAKRGDKKAKSDR